jgi:hypothetical protein
MSQQFGKCGGVASYAGLVWWQCCTLLVDVFDQAGYYAQADEGRLRHVVCLGKGDYIVVIHNVIDKITPSREPIFLMRVVSLIEIPIVGEAS